MGFVEDDDVEDVAGDLVGPLGGELVGQQQHVGAAAQPGAEVVDGAPLQHLAADGGELAKLAAPHLAHGRRADDEDPARPDAVGRAYGLRRLADAHFIEQAGALPGGEVGGAVVLVGEKGERCVHAASTA
jgi:hypothetical protein